MRRKIWKILLTVSLLVLMTMTAYAETSYGGSDWTVKFTSDKKMVSNFENSDIKKAVGELQPGDNVIITLTLKNENNATTDWYMENTVERSLEELEESVPGFTISGGAYTYKLVYTGPGTDKDGKELYNSDTVGGEDENNSGADKGLKQATDALEGMFFLDTLKKGESGKITLEVLLEGDTQGNDYQNTLAELNMRFAVELNTTGTNTQNPNPGTRGDIVRTGDEMDLAPFITVACVSGILLLLFAIYAQKEREKEKKRGGAVKYEKV